MGEDLQRNEKRGRGERYVQLVGVGEGANAVGGGVLGKVGKESHILGEREGGEENGKVGWSWWWLG